MKTFIFIGLMAFLTSGCVTSDQYSQRVRDQFVGKSIASAIAEYGEPTSSAASGDGRVYEWIRSVGYRDLASDLGAGSSSATERHCAWTVNADNRGTITDATWTGNACYNQLRFLH